MDPHFTHKKPKHEPEDETTTTNGGGGGGDEDEEQEEALLALIAHFTHKKPKHEPEDETTTTTTNGGGGVRGGDEDEDEEQEEALLALIAHRTHEVDHNKQRVSYYKSQLEISERRLKESQSQLARFRSRRSAAKTSTSTSHSNGVANGGPSPAQPQAAARPQLNIPAVNPKPPIITQSSTRPVLGKSSTSVSEKVKREPSTETSPPEKKRAKRNFEQREHQDLIPSIQSSSSPSRLCFQSSTHISSQHKRKLRSLVLCPVNDQIFITSALDGVVNLWQVQGKGHTASLLSSTDCVSPKQRRWPEDITWHPDGDSLFAVYSADGGDSQLSILNLNRSQDKKVTFLQEKPHLKGIINSILFMPWADLCFATGGSDHAVILWNEKDDSWKPKAVHRNQHSSAVMGVAGLHQKKLMLSVGADKRIVGFDLSAGRAEFKHQIESKCMSVLPNPTDFNLFMVQSGQPGKQLRLFDIRLRQTEIHAFGWKQESSESQSALINQAWSPDGLYLSSGSADPMIHIFDIRYKNSSPSQSVPAHQKRVFKAVWHQSIPIMTSISSDLNIGLHRIV